MMERILQDDFLEFQYLGGIKWNPSGNAYAFLQAHADVENNNYLTYIYVCKNGEITKLTATGNESIYVWENDDTILFSNMREQVDKDAVAAGEDRTVFYRISIHGGEAQKAYEFPLAVGKLEVIDQDRLLLHVRFDETYSIMYQVDEQEKKDLLKQKKEDEDYHILEQVPFYLNGAGYIERKRSTLFIYEIGSKTLTRICEPFFQVNVATLDTDTHRIYIAGNAFGKEEALVEGIWAYDIDTKQTIELLQPILSISDIKIRGNKLIVVGTDMKKFGINENPRFYELDIVNKELSEIYNLDRSYGSTVGSDARLLGGDSSCMHNEELFFITTEDGGSRLCKLTTCNEVEPVIELNGSVDSVAISKDTILYVAMKDMKLQEIYKVEKGVTTQVTRVNEDVLKDKHVAACEEVEFEHNGVRLRGWVLKPYGYDQTKSYPAILDIHGGPKTVYGPVYYHEMQVWASKGVFVFFMNPEGSDGKGDSFADIRGKYGTIDYDELMLFTDLVCKKYPAIDTTQLGVTGGSYGGFMTNWIIGHTDRFVSAASQRSISNWIGFQYSSDIGPYFAPDQQGASIFGDIEKLWWHSPLKYAQNVVTPTLFIHSDEDFRCPYFEGIQMYGALNELGVKTKLVMFKGENHELSRGGKPKHRVKRLNEITNWLFSYFKL